MLPKQQNKHCVHSFFSTKESKEEVICRINPANSDLFAGLIRVFEKGEAPMNENFRFFRDGFLLAYTMWCCTILPSRFQFKFEKMKPQ